MKMHRYMGNPEAPKNKLLSFVFYFWVVFTKLEMCFLYIDRDSSSSSSCNRGHDGEGTRRYFILFLFSSGEKYKCDDLLDLLDLSHVIVFWRYGKEGVCRTVSTVRVRVCLPKLQYNTAQLIGTRTVQ